MNYSKLILGIYGVLFAGLTIWAAGFFIQMHRELTAVRAAEAGNRRRLLAAEARLKEQEQYLDRLRNDPVLVERLIREKLGYVRAEEFIFRFEDAK